VEEILLLNKFFSDCRYMPSLRRYRAGHIYSHPVVSSFFLSFFPRLISAIADWMSTIVALVQI